MKVLIADAIDTAAIERIKQAGLEVTVATGLSPEALLETIPNFEVLVVRSNPKVTKKVIDAAERLKLIVRAGVGLDNIDVDAAYARNIVVSNTPGATAISVAEHVMGLMLALLRHIPAAHAKTDQGVWDKKSFMGGELFEKTLGVVGLGKIGREVAKRAKAFGMKIMGSDPIVDPETAAELHIRLVPFEEILAKSDVMTLHVPFLPETKNMLHQGNIGLMKKGAYLIFCARGGIADETAVANAVKSGHLAGAAFDVFETEPLPEASPLRNVPGIILTPHLGASTHEGQRRAGLELADIVLRFSNQK
ncbi:MAG: hypothetical protein HY540_02405 [Deltaproteobacteria bacterium]|nr:hypothetical protein [Deltaproteobacteria bacterium]